MSESGFTAYSVSSSTIYSPMSSSSSSGFTIFMVVPATTFSRPSPVILKPEAP